MPNHLVTERLQAILSIAQATHAGGSSLSSASKGSEREFFVDNVLSNVLAPPFRVGSGDITDSSARRSGQSDIVIEYGNSISFPLNSSKSSRLYLAEGVCAVIEIKSDLTSQWEEALKSHKALAPLQRAYSGSISRGVIPKNIPHFAVGYKGWKNQNTLKQKLEETSMEGILVLDPPLYYGKMYQETGPLALFAFFMTIEHLTGAMISATPNYLSYAN